MIFFRLNTVPIVLGKYVDIKYEFDRVENSNHFNWWTFVAYITREENAPIAHEFNIVGSNEELKKIPKLAKCSFQ